MNRNLYISPLDFLSGSDAAAIQAAVDEAIRTDIRVVVIPAREDGSAWQVDSTILLPSYTTVILDGCAIRGSGTIFANANAYKADTKTLGGEGHDLFLIGKGGATLHGDGDAPQVYLSNVKDFRVAGVAFKGGAGLALHFARIGKVQQLKFDGSRHGIAMSEGCSGLLVDDIDGVTVEETVLMRGGETTLYGRDPDIRKSILARIRAKTNGAPAVGLYGGKVPMSYLILRDVTDLTQGDGASVRLGESQEEIRDITIRGVDTVRTAVETTAACDGLHCANLGGGLAAKVANTRSRLDEGREAVALPRFEADREPDSFLTPNDPAFYAETDAQTIQNALNEASKQGVSLVIPRWNARTKKTVWTIEKALELPGDMTVELWGCHMRQADFCYDNMFRAKNAANVTITGVGNAVLDGGTHNGLLEKTAGKYGFGPIEDNALLYFADVNGLKLEHFRVKQSRWFAMYLRSCVSADIGNIDFSNYTQVADQGGIYVRSGCRDMLLHELTGVVSDDLLSLTAQGCDAASCEEQRHIQNVTIRDIKADSRRGNIVRIRNHDGRRVSGIMIDTLMDVSLAEQKMAPPMGVAVGATDGYYERKAEPGELSGVTVRDFCSRALNVITFGGYSENVTVDNIHAFGGTNSAVAVQPSAQVRNVKMSNIYFRCDQASAYMRGTATSIISDRKKYKGVALQLTNLAGEDIRFESLLCGAIGGGVSLTGGAQVHVSGLEADCGRFTAKCDKNSVLYLDGEKIEAAK